MKDIKNIKDLQVAHSVHNSRQKQSIEIARSKGSGIVESSNLSKLIAFGQDSQGVENRNIIIFSGLDCEKIKLKRQGLQTYLGSLINSKGRNNENVTSIFIINCADPNGRLLDATSKALPSLTSIVIENSVIGRIATKEETELQFPKLLELCIERTNLSSGIIQLDAPNLVKIIIDVGTGQTLPIPENIEINSQITFEDFRKNFGEKYQDTAEQRFKYDEKRFSNIRSGILANRLTYSTYISKISDISECLLVEGDRFVMAEKTIRACSYFEGISSCLRRMIDSVSDRSDEVLNFKEEMLQIFESITRLLKGFNDKVNLNPNLPDNIILELQDNTLVKIFDIVKSLLEIPKYLHGKSIKEISKNDIDLYRIITGAKLKIEELKDIYKVEALGDLEEKLNIIEDKIFATRSIDDLDACVAWVDYFGTKVSNLNQKLEEISIPFSVMQQFLTLISDPDTKPQVVTSYLLELSGLDGQLKTRNTNFEEIENSLRQLWQFLGFATEDIVLQESADEAKDKEEQASLDCEELDYDVQGLQLEYESIELFLNKMQKFLKLFRDENINLEEIKRSLTDLQNLLESFDINQVLLEAQEALKSLHFESTNLEEMLCYIDFKLKKALLFVKDKGLDYKYGIIEDLSFYISKLEEGDLESLFAWVAESIHNINESIKPALQDADEAKLDQKMEEQQSRVESFVSQFFILCKYIKIKDITLDSDGKIAAIEGEIKIYHGLRLCLEKNKQQALEQDNPIDQPVNPLTIISPLESRQTILSTQRE